MNDIYKIIGIVGGISIIMIPALNYLIGKWFKLEKELVKIKAERRDAQDKKVRDDLNGLGDKLRRLGSTLEHYEKLTIKMQIKVDEALKIFDSHAKKMSEVHDNLEKSVIDTVHKELFRLQNKVTIIEEENGK